jgi:hypothetical protein
MVVCPVLEEDKVEAHEEQNEQDEAVHQEPTQRRAYCIVIQLKFLIVLGLDGPKFLWLRALVGFLEARDNLLAFGGRIH